MSFESYRNHFYWLKSKYDGALAYVREVEEELEKLCHEEADRVSSEAVDPGPLFQETMNSMKPKLDYRRNAADRLKKEIDQVFREWEDAERDLLRRGGVPPTAQSQPGETDARPESSVNAPDASEVWVPVKE